jgi:hypothetical protein
MLGDSIYIQVVATNVKGDSIISLEGNGASIIQPPDAPVNLVEDVLLRSKSTLGLIWNAGSQDGGSPVLDYTIYIAE